MTRLLCAAALPSRSTTQMIAAFGRKRAANCLADTGGTTSDNRDATCQVQIHDERAAVCLSGYLLSTAMSRLCASVIAKTDSALTTLTARTYRQISHGLPPPAGNRAVAMIGVSPLA